MDAVSSCISLTTLDSNWRKALGGSKERSDVQKVCYERRASERQPLLPGKRRIVRQERRHEVHGREGRARLLEPLHQVVAHRRRCGNVQPRVVRM